MQLTSAVCNILCPTPKNCREGCAEQNVKLLDDTKYLEEFNQFINSLIETILHEDNSTFTSRPITTSNR